MHLSPIQKVVHNEPQSAQMPHVLSCGAQMPLRRWRQTDRQTDTQTDRQLT